MVHQKILIDEQMNSELQKEGFVVLPLLDAIQTSELTTYLNQKTNLDSGTFYATAHAQDVDFRSEMSDKIVEVIQGKVNQNFQNHELLGASFIVKTKQLNQVLQPHQDWNIVDESKYRSYNIWIPLVDLNEDNGVILVMPKSHAWIENYRHSSIPCSFQEVHEQLIEHMTPLYLKAGEALIYDHALLHASLPNNSQNDRIACACGIIPKGAEMKFYWNNEGFIEEYESSKAFFLKENVFTGPHGLKKIRTIENGFVTVDKEQFFDKAGIAYQQDKEFEIRKNNDIMSNKSFWKTYSFPNIIKEIQYRLSSLFVTKQPTIKEAIIDSNSTKKRSIQKHVVADVGDFYNQYNDKFLQVYGDIIQAFRTQDVSILLDYQIDAMQLKEGMKILDAGCGVCGPATYFSEKTGVLVDAITISEEQVNRAEEKIIEKKLENKVRVRKGDYHQINKVFHDEVYDVVYFLESFGHSPYHEKALDSAWDVLKPGGLLYIKDLFRRLPLISEHGPKIDFEIQKINEAYRYNVADLNSVLDHARKKGFIISAVKTIDLKMDEFENLMISNEFQELTGIAKIENWDDYVFPIDFFEMFLYKPQFDLQYGLDKYFLQNLMYMQVHGKKQEEL
jgi:cyclopropane fatty-acyl-phospholipid synthase-like methyltransferase